MGHTLIFDIGKTNKKCFIFDNKYKVVYEEFASFEDLKDEDGFPCDDLEGITFWVFSTMQKALASGDFNIETINFSTYGASLVHLGKDGKPITPLYSYLKPYPESVLDSFYEQYGAMTKIAKETASPPLRMLNSGLQIYWLKHARPEIFQKVRWSMHLPQYLCYLLTGFPVSEYTSIGCHTALWNFETCDYHEWVYAEGIDRILPPIISAERSINARIYGKTVKVGVGIHDSSAALVPYLRADKKPFLLLSTGTWNIAMNPFNTDQLTDSDLQHDCLNFLGVNGESTKATRLFLGDEHQKQLAQLQAHFWVTEEKVRRMKFNEELYASIAASNERFFHFNSIAFPRVQPPETSLKAFENFKVAYHQLLFELVELQVEGIRRAIGETPIKKLYIDGGFAKNKIFVKMLARELPDLKIRTTEAPLGSAIGASMVVENGAIKKQFLKKNYALRKIKLKRSQVPL